MSALALPPAPRSPWQRLYAGVHRLRHRWYRERAGRLPRPVVSVGNLSFGGSGKTPLVAAIALHLRDRGLFPAILSRGYGRRDGAVRVVSRGAGPLLAPRLAGDEPALLAAELPGVAVVVGADRLTAGRAALNQLVPGPGIFLLDDGFSHLRLARDLDILAFPAADPFGGGRLLPTGRLREPLAAAARADAVVLTGEPGERGDELAAALRPLGFRGPGFVSRTRVLPLTTDRPRPPMPGERVLAVTAIARPRPFLDELARLGFEVAASLTLRDHHLYPEATLERIRATWRGSGAAWVVTTAKDQVKLAGRLELPLAVLPIRAEPEAAFWAWLDERLTSLAEGAV